MASYLVVYNPVDFDPVHKPFEEILRKQYKPKPVMENVWMIEVADGETPRNLISTYIGDASQILVVKIDPACTHQHNTALDK